MAAIDFLVIGGGSAGVATARRAASYGKRVVLVEGGRMGGTCVNVGCVPKKVMWHAAEALHRLSHAQGYGISGGGMQERPRFDMSHLKPVRDAYVTRLNGIYRKNLESSGVRIIDGWASFVGPRRVRVDGADGAPAEELDAAAVLIASGGRPWMPDIPGIQHAITSDGFFALETVPQRVAVIGGGYIAIELAGILQQLGSSVTMLVRGAAGDGLLRGFDADIRASLAASLTHAGVNVEYGFSPSRIDQTEGSTPAAANGAPAAVATAPPTSGRLVVTAASPSPDGALRVVGPFDVVISATGRVPNTESLGLAVAGVATIAPCRHESGGGGGGRIVVDAWQATTAPGVYAVGDVSAGPHDQLTPVAIAAGRLLADRLFRPVPSGHDAVQAPAPSGGGDARLRLEYEAIPTVVFSHPPIGAVGLTQADAEAVHGADRVRVFVSKFTPLYYGVLSDKVPTIMKLVTVLAPGISPGSPEAADGANLRVVGIHMQGDNVDEMLQGFAVAVRMGASKADFDATVAIHPTGAEELVTMVPWRPRLAPLLASVDPAQTQ